MTASCTRLVGRAGVVTSVGGWHGLRALTNHRRPRLLTHKDKK